MGKTGGCLPELTMLAYWVPTDIPQRYGIIYYANNVHYRYRNEPKNIDEMIPKAVMNKACDSRAIFKSAAIKTIKMLQECIGIHVAYFLMQGIEHLI